MAVDYAPDQAKQAARERFRGVWAASTVPFGADGGLDIPALRRDMARLTGDLAAVQPAQVQRRVRRRRLLGEYQSAWRRKWGPSRTRAPAFEIVLQRKEPASEVMT